MAILGINSGSLNLPSESTQKLVDMFRPALSRADKKANDALNAFKRDPSNQAKALDAQAAQSALDNLWKTLTAMIESMGKTMEAIINAMRV